MGGGVGADIRTPPLQFLGGGDLVLGPNPVGPGRAAGRAQSRSQDSSSPSASFVTACVLGCQLHPSDGVARQRGSEVRAGLLICQLPADTWLRLLPAYPEEGLGHAACILPSPGSTCTQGAQGSTREGGPALLTILPPALRPALPPILCTPAGSSLPVPAPFLPSSPNHRKAKCSGGKEVSG